MSMCRVFSCVVGKGYLLWPVHSLGKTLLAFALFHLVLQGQTFLLLQVFLDFLLLHPSPLWRKWHLIMVLALEGVSSKTATRCWTTISRRRLDHTKKKIPYIQRQRKSPNKMVGGAKSSLESNLYTPETLRGLKKIKIKIKKKNNFVGTRTQRPHRDWAKAALSVECLLQKRESAVACHRDRGSGCSRPGTHSMWHKPSRRRSPLAPP